ncbi:MAG: hypothetical protein AAF596_06810, partial [Planctomycetota bacterium]
MAARQDQTLQIALILSGILVLVLIGFLVYVNELRKGRVAEAQAAVEQSRKDKSALNAKVTEAGQLRTFIGFTEFEEFQSVQDTFNQDMENYAATLAADQRAYRQIVESIFEENRRSTNQEREAKEQIKQLNEKLLALEKAKETQIDQFKASLQKVESDAAAERNKFNQARADLEQKRDELARALDRQRAEEKKRVDVFRRQIAKQAEEITRLQDNMRRLIARTPVDNPSSEIADGAVTWVDQGKGIAWINLGSADALRRQVTFSVYEQDSTDAGKAEKKGSLEVTKILGDHRAEVQITSDTARNPVLPGDWIYSQVWHRGSNLHFALTGVIDFDGDGRNDIEQAKDLIALNGATLDAVLEEDGTVTGEMNVNTRYLVLGDFPGSASQAELRKGWKTMSDDADTFGVDKITLQQFLDQMGYRPTGRTVAFGGGARDTDFLPKRKG